MRKSYMIYHQINYFNFICIINSVFRFKYKISKSKGVLGEINKEDCNKIVKKLKEDGYFVFNQTLNSNLIDNLYHFASETPINFLELKSDGNIELSVKKEKYSINKNNSILHQFIDPKSLFESDVAKNIFFDQNFLHIANEYLNCKPWLDAFTMWWSNPVNNIFDNNRESFKSAAAQMFHYDMDRLKFIKFFIYLTDVTDENGPHIYVKKSHNKPLSYLKNDNRYSDDLIYSHEKNNIVKLTGKKGTIMVVDTRGLHKGMELIIGERLVLQVQFTNSLFGNKNFNDYNYKIKESKTSKFDNAYKLYVDYN